MTIAVDLGRKATKQTNKTNKPTVFRFLAFDAEKVPCSQFKNKVRKVSHT